MSLAVLSRKDEAALASVRAPSKAASNSLRIGEPSGSLEQEADRVADAMMAGDRSRASWSISRTTIDTSLQRKAVGPAPSGDAPPIVHEVLRSPGRPLDTATQHFFEMRLGHDLSAVRIHTDDRAVESATAVDALAYTVGNHVAFAADRFAPSSGDGRKLLAHELTHAVQQSHGTVSVQERLGVASPQDVLEIEANRVAMQIDGGSVARSIRPMGSVATSRIFRQTLPSATGTGNPQGRGAPSRVVFLDSDVLSQIAGGNKPAAEKLLELRSNGADIRIARPTYNETQRGRPQQVAARRLIVERLGIKIDEGAGLGSRLPTYEAYAQKGVKVQEKDLPMVAAAKAANGEIWSFDGGVKSNVAQLGVKLAPESSLPSLKTPLDVRAGLDNVNLHDFNIAIDGTVTRKPSGGGPSGGGTPPAGTTPHGEGEPSGGVARGRREALSPPNVVLAPLPEGSVPRPPSQSEIVARQRLIAQLESETVESTHFAGRLRAYGTVFGALIEVYSAITAVDDALTLQAEGTLLGKAQGNADKIAARSKEDLSKVQNVTEGISLLQTIASVSQARERGDQDALFDLSGALGNISMTLTESADTMGQMAKQLTARVHGLQILSKFYQKLVETPVPGAGTLPQAQAFEMYVSIEKLIGPLMTATQNYNSAAATLSFYANYSGSLGHEANKSAWTLILRRVAQGQQASAPAPVHPDQSHSTPSDVHAPSTPSHDHPTGEGQHQSLLKGQRLMTDEELRESLKLFYPK